MNIDGLHPINIFDSKWAIVKNTLLGNLCKTFFNFTDVIQGQMTKEQTSGRWSQKQIVLFVLYSD